MKKIYYLQKYEIKLGDIVEYNGIKAPVTEELIELNPELFRVEKNTQPMYFKCVKGKGNYTKGRIYKQKYSINYPIAISLTNDKGITENVHYWEITCIKHAYNCFELSTKEEWDKQELLDEAKKRYPVGTVYKHLNSEYTPKSNFLVATKSDYHFDSAGYFQNAIWGDGSDNYCGVVYHDGEWAKVLPLKFITEDGVDIYGDMRTYMVYSNLNMSNESMNNEGTNSTIKYFYHRENALAYIEKHKKKTLEDYEDILLNDKNLILIDDTVAFKGYFYKYLKEGEPKLYYTKILQLIADDLNDGWVADFTNADEKWCISEKDIIHYVKLRVHGPIYFESKELAEKARDILGDKLEYLFN